MKKVFVILFLFNILLYSKTLDELLFSAVENNNIKKVQSYLEQGANCNALDSYDRTALINASVSGYDDIAKLLIKEGTDVNIRDKAGATALMYTARDTNYEMVEFLLKNGADVNIRNTEGETALYYSIQHDSFGQENAIKILNLLIKYGADVNTKNYEGTSLLDVSYRISESFDKNKEMFKILVENGFDLESRIKTGRSDYDYTPLMIAALRNDYDMVKYLLDKGANPNTANNENKTALMIAIANNNFDISKLLIQQGANINTKDEYGYTALMRAAMIGSYEMVKFLLENDANINTKDNDGNTVLYYNIYYADYGELENAKKIFNLLIKYGADVNTKDNYGASLLDTAYTTELALNREMFKVLVENGFDLESRIDGGEHSPDDYDYTPLMIAAAINDYDMVKFLVEKGADVNAKTHFEYSSVVTPLLLSLDNENSSVAEYLINNGADINVTNEDGETPLMYASKVHNIKVIELLIQKGADINAFDNYGNTALIYGVNNLETVKLLVENGADVNFYKGGSTALISACEYSHERNIDVIKYLVSKNANINAQDNKGDTALNKTLDTSDEGSIDILDFEIAHFLIEQGADVNIKNKREYTPFIYLGMGEGNFNNKSFQEYRIKLAEVLLEKGADINAKDYNGYTSLMWACASSGSRFAEPYVKFLVEKGADINIEDNHGDTALDIAENLKLRKIVSILKKAQRAQRNRN